MKNSENPLPEFKELISSEPNRKGQPNLVSPEEMKSIWRTAK